MSNERPSESSRALFHAEEQLRLLVEQVRDYAIFRLDPQGKVASWNAGAQLLKGYSAEEIVGTHFSRFYLEKDREAGVPARALEVALKDGRFEARGYRLRKDGSRFWANVIITPMFDENGVHLGFGKVTRDLTAQRRADDDLRFLAAASKVLSSSLDWQQTLRSVCDLAVPELADWCAMEMVKPDGTTEQLAVAHQDPAKIQLAHDLREKYPPDPNAPGSVRSVIRSNQPLLIEQIPEEMLVQGARSPEHLALIRQLGMRSALVLPIPTRRGVAGAISFVTAELGRRLTQKDLPFFEELAQRIGLAIENSRLYTEAQAAIQKRDDFLSIASHELKTPLTSLDLHIEGLKRLLLSDRLAALPVEKVAERLKTVERQSDRLRQLIEDLLDVARISAGKMVLVPESFDLGELVVEVIRRSADQSARAGCEVKLDLEQELFGSWDRSRVDQVLVNFLSNAIKYGANKPVEVTLRRADSKARLSVRDHGIGVDLKDQERIFERFERATSIRSFGGLGLGLWICRQIVDAHGGTLSVKSALAEGSTFTMELPL